VRSRGARSFSGCSPPSGEDGDNRADWTCYGLYYDTAAPATFDLGCERSNYHGAYRSADVGEAALDYYMLLGGCEGLPSVTRRFLRLTGSHPAVPRWALGYGMTAMPLADAPDAQARITAFVARAAAEGVPASSFHFGSGYTLVGGQRCVFTWNAERFPQPEALLGALHAAGLHVVANVKPCLLDAHPFFAAAAQRGLCVRAPPPDGGPALAQFWDGIGAHVDFGNGDAAAWWTERCGGALLSRGVDAIWNDNNEYEIFEEGATCADVLGGDPSRQAAFAPQRALQPLLMAAASMAATSAAAPGARAFGVSRAMSPGCQRLCSTWTGDNDSSWRSLRWGLRCCMQLALSGMYYAGTDVGGFAGPVPDAELLARWFQAAALLPRMVSNSWKACGTVTSPWLHDYAKPACLAALRLRYALLPYIYTLCRAASDGRDEPVARPTLWDFGGADEASWDECDELMLGPSLLGAPVVAPGARQRTLRLPAGPACWYDFYSGAAHVSGADVTVPAPLDTLPLFCPAGTMLPLAPGAHAQRAPHDAKRRRLRVFPFPCGGASVAELFEDDGATADGLSATLRFAMRCTADEVAISVAIAREGEPAYALPYEALEVALPPGETRRVTLRSEGAAPRLVRCDGWDWQAHCSD